MGEKSEAVCIKCRKAPANLLRCRECLTCFCGGCFPPFVVDSGVIADKMFICPKCNGRDIEQLNKLSR